MIPDTKAIKKNRFFKWFVRILLLILILPVAILGTIRLGGWWKFRVPDKEIHASFSRSPIEFVIDSIRWKGYPLGYARSSLGTRKKEALIFIHGSPGSLDAGLPYLRDTTLLHRVDVISYDRPGFGNSKFGVPSPTLVKQAQCLHHLMDSLGYQKYWLMGHSYGAPVAVQTVLRYPQNIAGLCLVAGSLSPDLESASISWRKWIDMPFIREIMPKSLSVSNEELIPLRNELFMMQDNWQEIEVPVLIIHGSKDVLVDFKNAKYAEQQLVNSELVEMDTLQGGDHFILWTQNHRIVRDLHQWWNDIEKKRDQAKK